VLLSLFSFVVKFGLMVQISDLAVPAVPVSAVDHHAASEAANA
jgi:hypothetical protein